MLRVTRFNAVPKPPPRTWRASLWMLASVCARFRYKSRMQSEEELVRTFMVMVMAGFCGLDFVRNQKSGKDFLRGRSRSKMAHDQFC